MSKTAVDRFADARLTAVLTEPIASHYDEVSAFWSPEELQEAMHGVWAMAYADSWNPPPGEKP